MAEKPEEAAQSAMAKAMVTFLPLEASVIWLKVRSTILKAEGGMARAM